MALAKLIAASAGTGLTFVEERVKRRLLIFGVNRLSEILAKGNIDYVRHYECYFDSVYVIYLYGQSPQPIVRGRTTFISVGSRTHPWLDMLIAPFRLLRIARQLRPTAYLTADQVFSFWTGWMLRAWLRAEVVLVPVCMPEEIYKSTNRSLSGVPIVVERYFTHLCYAAAAKVITSRHVEEYVKWLASDLRIAPKLQVVECIVDELPSIQLLQKLEDIPDFARPLNDPPRLLYVGRLHREKLASGLIDMLAAVRGAGVPARLVIAGDGPDFEPMRARALQLGVAGAIEWLGFVQAGELADVYRGADIFVATVTGTALREAGLAGLPVVGYDIDWVCGLLEHEQTALLVRPGDTAGLAKQITRALQQPELRECIGRNFHALARSRWNSDRVAQGLAETFGKIEGT